MLKLEVLSRVHAKLTFIGVTKLHTKSRIKTSFSSLSCDIKPAADSGPVLTGLHADCFSRVTAVISDEGTGLSGPPV